MILRALLFSILLISFSCREKIENTYESTGILYVTNKKDNTLISYDLSRDLHTSVFETGIEPHETALSYDGRYLAISNYKGSSLTILDTKTESLKQIAMDEGSKPHGLEFIAGSNQLLCTSEGTDELLLIDVVTGTVEKRLNTSGKPSHMLVIHPVMPIAYLTNKVPGALVEVDLENWEMKRSIPMEGNVEGLEISPTGNELWVTRRDLNQIAIIDTRSFRNAGEIETDEFPVRVKIRPDNSQAIVVNAAGNSLQVFDAGTKDLIREISFKSGLEFIFDLFNKTPKPVAIFIHEDNRYAFIATTNADKIYVLDLDTWEFTGEFETGDLPDGLIVKY